MPFPHTYQSSMTGVGQIAHSNEAGHVRIKALALLIRELSPSNAKTREIHHALDIPPHPEPAPKPRPNHSPRLPEAPLTPEQKKDFHLHPDRDEFFKAYEKIDAIMRGEDVPPMDDDDSLEEEEEPQ